LISPSGTRGAFFINRYPSPLLDRFWREYSQVAAFGELRTRGTDLWAHERNTSAKKNFARGRNGALRLESPNKAMAAFGLDYDAEYTP
jgi:hypothetical protein